MTSKLVNWKLKGPNVVKIEYIHSAWLLSPFGTLQLVVMSLSYIINAIAYFTHSFYELTILIIVNLM